MYTLVPYVPKFINIYICTIRSYDILCTYNLLCSASLLFFSFLHMYLHRLSDCRWRGDNACGGRGKRELRNAVRRRTLIAVGVAAHLALGTV